MAGGAAPRGRSAIDLTPSSPFMPPGGNAQDSNAAPAGSSLELHGIVSTPQGYKFDLFDPTSHKDAWVGFNETGKPYVVQSQDIAHNRVTVEYQGRQITLTLPQPKVAPMGGGQSMTVMPSPMMNPMTTSPPMTAAPANIEDERRRIELITEEIRRRRALRAAQQRQLQMQPGAVPAPPQPRNY